MSVQSITVSAPAVEHSAAGARRLGERDRALAARRDNERGKVPPGVELLGTADFEERDRLTAETITLEAEWVEVRQLVVSATAPGGRPSRRDAVRTAQRNKD